MKYDDLGITSSKYYDEKVIRIVNKKKSIDYLWMTIDFTWLAMRCPPSVSETFQGNKFYPFLFMIGESLRETSNLKFYP